MTNRKRSYLNFASAALGQLLAMIIGFLLPRLFITNFGSEIYGLLNSGNEILMYLALFEAGVGAVTLQALYGPVARKKWDNISGVLSATNVYYKKAGVLYFAVLSLVALAYPLAVSVPLPQLTVSLVIFFIGLPQAISLITQAKYILLLKADGRSYVITNVATVITVLTGIAKVVLLMNGVDALLVIIAQCGMLLAQALILSRYTKKRYSLVSVHAAPDYQSISQKNYSLIHQISALVFQSTDIMILTMVLGLKYVSIYSIYKLVMSQIGNVVYTLQNSVDFILGQTYQTDRKKFVQRIDQYESWFSAIAFAICAVVFYVLYDFVALYTKGVQDAVYADKTLVLLFMMIELLSVIRAPMLQTISYAGHFKNTMPQSVFESIINLTVSLIAVNFLGMYGVLAGTIIALFYRTNDIIIYANTRLLKRSPLKTYMIHMMNIAVFIVVQFLFRAIFSDITSWLDLLITGILAGLISVLLFVSVQTAVWPDNRSTFLFYLKNRGSRLRQILKAGKDS